MDILLIAGACMTGAGIINLLYAIHHWADQLPRKRAKIWVRLFVGAVAFYFAGIYALAALQIVPSATVGENYFRPAMPLIAASMAIDPIMDWVPEKLRQALKTRDKEIEKLVEKANGHGGGITKDAVLELKP